MPVLRHLIAGWLVGSALLGLGVSQAHADLQLGDARLGPFQQRPPLQVTPQPITHTPGWRVVGTDGEGARVRQGPSTQAAVIGSLAEGALVDPVGGPLENEGIRWIQVRIPAGSLGWVAGQLLQSPDGSQAPPPAPTTPPAAPPPATTPDSGPFVIGNTDGLGANLREGPSTEARVLVLLPDGTLVDPIEGPISFPNDTRAWRKVRAGEREGWVISVVVRPQ